MSAGIEARFRTQVGAFAVDVAFGVPPGITALFGPSGSGKSVALATVAGLLRPTVGRVVLDGRMVADAAAGVHVRTQDRRIGMVFQQAALLPHRSPLDNVALAVRADRRADRRRIAGEVLEQVHASHLARSSTTTLSGGEQQRVALARALAGSPGVLLLDEPFSALDLEARQAMRRLVRQLVTERRLTALLVTHDTDDVADLADRVVRFAPGRTLGTESMS